MQRGTRPASSPSPPPSPASPPTSFPSGTYAKYKRATQCFLDWLLRARASGVGVGASRDPRSRASSTTAPLDVYERIVAAIAREPSQLPPVLLQHWPRAMAACASAITLRERMALFFAPLADTDAALAKADADQHAYFLTRLRVWYETLQQAYEPLDVAMRQKLRIADPEPLDFTNYYDVLRLPVDYFADVADDTTSAAAPTVLIPKTTRLSKADRTRLDKETFVEDVQSEMAWVFMELEELSEAVHESFAAVKRHEKTLIEAAVVTKVAIDGANAILARLQLRYPSIAHAGDLLRMMEDYLTGRDLETLLRDVRATNGSTYVGGTILFDMMGVARALLEVVGTIEAHAGSMLPIDETQWVATYTVPGAHDASAFVRFHLPRVLNVLLDAHDRDHPIDLGGSHAKTFLLELRRFSWTSAPSLELVFLCVCWVRSVAALQGDGDLERHVNVAVEHWWTLEQRTADAWHELTTLLQSNPLLAGLALVDKQLAYAHIAFEALGFRYRFDAFCHLYSALRDRRLLDPVTPYEALLPVYEDYAFLPTSRAAATHGLFTRTYMLSVEFTNAKIDAIFQRRAPVAERFERRARERVHLFTVSRIAALLRNNDYSVLPSDATASGSWRTLLASVSDICSHELFGSRVLSVDLLRVGDDMRTAFTSLSEDLGCGPMLESMRIWNELENDNKWSMDSAVVTAVMLPLMPLLDCMNLDGTSSITEDAAGWFRQNLTRLRGLVMNDAIEYYCTRAAETVATSVGDTDSARVEREYYTLPPTAAAWTTVETGDTEEEANDQPVDSFETVFDMLATSTGPLSETQVDRLKRLVTHSPHVLAMVRTGTESNLCTLLHQAAAGVARDRRLVLWLIQMRALDHQPVHVYDRRTSAVDKDETLCDDLAVHAAARVGLVDMVQLLLEASHLRDLRVATYHTNQTLVEIAIQNNDRALLQLLRTFGVNVSSEVTSLAPLASSDSSIKSKNKKKKTKKTKVSDADAGSSGSTSETVSPRSVDVRPLVPSDDWAAQFALDLETLKPTVSAKRDVLGACAVSVVAVLEKQRARLEVFAKATDLSAFPRDIVLRELHDASRLIFLLNKYHRHLREIRKFVRHEIWQFDPLAVPDEPLDQFLAWAGAGLSFERFFAFVLRTAELLIACERRPQADELLVLLERRLLKLKQRTSTFRGWVERVVDMRRKAGLAEVLGSTAEARRHFEWYATRHGVRDHTTIYCLDLMFGICSIFIRFKSVNRYTSPAFAAFESAVKRNMGEIEVVMAFHDGYVAVGAEAPQALSDAAHVIQCAARKHGVTFDASEPVDAQSTLQLLGFTFSATAIVRTV